MASTQPRMSCIAQRRTASGPAALARVCLIGLVALAGLAGCASFDPHGLLSRGGGTDPGVLDAGARVAIFDQVWRTVGDGYYDPALHGVDWPATAALHRSAALAADGDEAYWAALDRMLGTLHDSHTRVESPREVRWRTREAGGAFGFGVRMIDGALWVESVEPSSAAAAAGVKRGMRLQWVDDRDAAAAWLALRQTQRRNSTPQAQDVRTDTQFFLSLPDAPVAMSFARADGSALSAVLGRPARVTPPAVQSRRLPSGHGLVRLSAFVPVLLPALMSALAEHRSAPGIVIDLRGNRGGSFEMVGQLADALVAQPAAYARTLTRSGQPVTMLFGMVQVIGTDLQLRGSGIDAYPGRVVVLVDRASASAAELLAATLQMLGRAQVVGETSCGCLLGFLGYVPLRGGARLAYSEVGFVLADGSRVEGRGVRPDRGVAVTPQTLLADGDAALDAALALLAAGR